MAKKNSKKKKPKLAVSFNLTYVIGGVVLIFLLGGFSTFHYVRANNISTPITITDIDPNFGVKNRVVEFLTANDAEELIPIIKCESRFRHFEKDGTPLKNRAGSSAIGVAQILSSAHPDPKIIYRYNKRFNMEMSIEDFDVNTFEGNIGYALVLYKVRGTRDWECAKKFKF